MVVAPVATLQSRKSLRCEPKRIGYRNPDAASAHVEAKNAAWRGISLFLHAAIIGGLSILPARRTRRRVFTIAVAEAFRAEGEERSDCGARRACRGDSSRAGRSRGRRAGGPRRASQGDNHAD